MTNDTITLTCGIGNRTQYEFSKMYDYCTIVDKEINELSKEEMKQFEIKGEDE